MGRRSIWTKDIAFQSFAFAQRQLAVILTFVQRLAYQMNNSSSEFNEFGESDQIYTYTVWVTSVQQILSIFGIALNSALVFITIKHKSLHRSYGLLLAICSLCDALTEFSTPLATVFFVLVFLRRRIPLITCFYIQCINTAACLNSYMNLFLISLDRIGSLAFPMQYRFMSKSSGKYVIIGNAFSLSIVFYNIYLAFSYALNHPEIKVYCEPGDSFQGDAFTIGTFIMMSFTLTTIVIYIIMWIMLKVIRSDGNNNNSNNNKSSQQKQLQIEITRRIFKSLAVIMAVIFVGWFMSGMIVTVVAPRLFANDPAMQFVITHMSFQLCTIAGAINAPVLYFCSSEYRNIFKSEFRWII